MLGAAAAPCRPPAPEVVLQELVQRVGIVRDIPVSDLEGAVSPRLLDEGPVWVAAPALRPARHPAPPPLPPQGVAVLAPRDPHQGKVVIESESCWQRVRVRYQRDNRHCTDRCPRHDSFQLHTSPPQNTRTDRTNGCKRRMTLNVGRARVVDAGGRRGSTQCEHPPPARGGGRPALRDRPSYMCRQVLHKGIVLAVGRKFRAGGCSTWQSGHQPGTVRQHVRQGSVCRGVAYQCKQWSRTWGAQEGSQGAQCVRACGFEHAARGVSKD
jgi:hypothetical protein